MSIRPSLAHDASEGASMWPAVNLFSQPFDFKFCFHAIIKDMPASR